MKQIAKYDFEHINSRGNYLVLWMHPIEPVRTDYEALLNEVYDVYTDHLCVNLGSDVRHMLNNYEEGGIESTFIDTLLHNYNGQYNVLATSDAWALCMDSDGQMYLTMYDYIEYESLEAIHSDLYKRKVKNGFAEAVNAALNSVL